MSNPIYIYLRSSLTEFDNTMNPAYHLRSAPHWAGGFSRPVKQGAEDMRLKVHVFFYALQFMAVSVLGGVRLPSPCLGRLTRYIHSRPKFSRFERLFNQSVRSFK